jgi:histone H3/H4
LEVAASKPVTLKKGILMSKKGKKGTTFAGARLERILRNAGALRVSAGAIKAMDDAISAKGNAISKKAVSIAKNAGRKTVSADDINLASRA